MRAFGTESTEQGLLPETVLLTSDIGDSGLASERGAAMTSSPCLNCFASFTVFPEGPLDQNAQPGDLLAGVDCESCAPGACCGPGAAGSLEDGGWLRLGAAVQIAPSADPAFAGRVAAHEPSHERGGVLWSMSDSIALGSELRRWTGCSGSISADCTVSFGILSGSGFGGSSLRENQPRQGRISVLALLPSPFNFLDVVSSGGSGFGVGVGFCFSFKPRRFVLDTSGAVLIVADCWESPGGLCGESAIASTLVVEAATGSALLDFLKLRDRYIEGDAVWCFVPLAVEPRAVVTSSEALSVAARMLSLATCVTGIALLPRRNVPPPYHVLGLCAYCSESNLRPRRQSRTKIPTVVSFLEPASPSDMDTLSVTVAATG